MSIHVSGFCYCMVEWAICYQDVSGLLVYCLVTRLEKGVVILYSDYHQAPIQMTKMICMHIDCIDYF